MVGLKISSQGNIKVLAADLQHKAIWEFIRTAKAFKRKFGWFGYGVLVCVAISLGALVFERKQAGIETKIRSSSKDIKQLQVGIEGTRQPDARLRMLAFQNHLLPHDEIPDVVQSLLKLAEEEKLWISRGEYRPQIDLQGDFLRYRMTLPVKGDAQAIYRFMRAALRTQKALALESVQFKRERIQSQNIDARIQWVVLTRLPSGVGKKTVEKGE